MQILRLRERGGSLVAGSGLMLSSLAVGAGLAFGTSVVIARALSVDEYGILSLFLSLQGFIVIFASFGVPRTLAKFVPEYSVMSPPTAGRIARMGILQVVVISLIVAGVYASMSGVIGTGLYGDSRLDPLVPFSALVVVTTAVQSSISGLAQGYRNIGIVAFVRVMSPFVSLMSIVILLPMFKIEGVFIGYAVGQSATIAVAACVLCVRNPEIVSSSGQSYHPSYKPKALFRFSEVSFLSNIVIVAGIWVGNTVLTLEAGLESVGYFGIAYGFYVALILVPAAITVPFLPRVSVLSLDSADKVRNEVEKVLRATASITFPVVIALGISSEMVIEMMYGAQYSPAKQIVLLMILASYINTNATIITTAFVGVGRISLFFRLQMLWAVVFITLACLLVPFFGVDGLGAAYVLSYLAMLAQSFRSSAIVFSGKMLVSSGTVILGILLVCADFLMLMEPAVPFLYPLMLGVLGTLLMIRAPRMVNKPL